MSAAAARRVAWAALAALLVLALALRLWGIRQGLPYVYNLDESDHFVPHAVEMFRHGLNPHYFANPPALTYLEHYLFLIWFGGAKAAEHVYSRDPGRFYEVARGMSAVLGTLAVWELYVLGTRLFGRLTGLIAAAVEAFAFLPVFYSRLALNDVPTLVPLTLSLIGSVGYAQSGRRRELLLAAVGLGLACATKYTAGVVVLALIAALVLRARRPATASANDQRSTDGGARINVERPVSPPLKRRGSGAPRVLAAVALAVAVALLAFLIANPYSLLDFHAFRHELAHQSSLASESQGKLGSPRNGGFAYYLWTLTWGLGWVPALAALGGAVLLWRRDALARWLLIPTGVAFLLFMGSQGRYFGRWLLPVFPVLCLLAAYLCVEGSALLLRARPRLRGALVAAATIALIAQGLVHSARSSVVLARADTRQLTREWMLAHVPAGSRIVIEPVVPNAWLQDVGHDVQISTETPRWSKYLVLRTRLDPATGAPLANGPVVSPEDYERTLGPALVGYYAEHGYCWVISGYTQSGRAYSDPSAVPHAIAYYEALARESRVEYEVSPYRSGHGPVPFGFDWTFDYYPLAYARPGPTMTVYRLLTGRCATDAA
ncbi:MAG TPA: glycosyltransferase family 39 protein [Solirubrobacteraceae bacterium]|jgi:hypothetical protein|nr:glycosyltransferase family 39 protein [Solirubrobacteraceae bacterium]